MCHKITHRYEESQYQESFAYDTMYFARCPWEQHIHYPSPMHREGGEYPSDKQRVFFFEPPCYEIGSPHLDVSEPKRGTWIIHPIYSLSSSLSENTNTICQCIDALMEIYAINSYVAWYEDPLALTFSGHLEPLALIFTALHLFDQRWEDNEYQQWSLLLFETSDVIILTKQQFTLFKQATHRSPASLCQGMARWASSVYVMPDTLEEGFSAHHPLWVPFQSHIQGLLCERFNWPLFSHAQKREKNAHHEYLSSH